MFKKLQKSYTATIYSCYLGYITQAIVNNLAPLLFLIFREQFGLSLQQITLITTINFGVQLLTDLVAAKYVDRIGYRPCIVAAHVFAAFGLIGMAVLPQILPGNYPGLLTAAVLYAVGGGLLEVLVSPIVEACPSDHKASAMSLLHSFYCWGTVAVVALSTLYLYLFGKDAWRILTCLWAIVPIFTMILFLNVPINRLTDESESMTIPQLMKSGLFWIFVLLMITAGASEQAMSQWASAFAESGLRVSKMVGDLAGPCFFSILMGIARAIYGNYGHKLNLKRFIYGSLILCVFSYLLAVYAPNAGLSLIGCGLCGLSVGIMWPGVFSMASESMPKGGTAMFALLALGGDIGCGSGPTVVGFVADACAQNLKAGLLAAIVFPILMFVGMQLLRKTSKNEI